MNMRGFFIGRCLVGSFLARDNAHECTNTAVEATYKAFGKAVTTPYKKR